jgi:uncharacterized protein (DUF1330 family)
LENDVFGVAAQTWRMTMTAYCLFQNLEITDMDKMQQYATTVEPITHAFKGQYVTKAGEVDVKEGEWAPI